MKAKGAKLVMLCEFLVFNLLMVHWFPDWAAVFLVFTVLVLIGAGWILWLDLKERRQQGYQGPVF